MVHVAFHNQAIETPTAPALIDAVTGKVWSYRETQLKVLSLASELRAAGTEADRVVAIYMDPSPRYVVSMLAALSAGGAVSLSESIVSHEFIVLFILCHLISFWCLMLCSMCHWN